MEYIGFKKDKNEYLIFRCVKCNHYSYVKSTQKTKKCLRCNRTYQVRKIQYETIVKGITKALETVKKKQNEEALKEFQEFPELRAKLDYVPSHESTPTPNQMQGNKKNDNKDEYYTTFLATLKDIKKVYTKIPRYFLSILLERAKIPKSKLKVLINHALKDNRLIRIKDNYFKINIEKE